MRFSGPDHAVLTAWEALCKASVAQAVDLAATEGLWHAERCPRCGSDTYHETESRWGGVAEVCKRCGLPWPTRPASVLKGIFQTSASPRRGTSSIVRAGDVLALVSRVPEPTLTIYACWLITGLGYGRTAEIATEQGWGGVAWNDTSVRREVGRGRRWLRAELEAAGILRAAA